MELRNKVFFRNYFVIGKRYRIEIVPQTIFSNLVTFEILNKLGSIRQIQTSIITNSLYTLGRTNVQL